MLQWRQALMHCYLTDYNFLVSGLGVRTAYLLSYLHLQMITHLASVSCDVRCNAMGAYLLARRVHYLEPFRLKGQRVVK